MSSVAKNLYGVFPIYKPSGCTTNAIMNILKKTLGVEKMKHSGALSNYSEGIVIVGLGDAVKYNESIRGHTRMYLVRGVLGVSTSTFDSNGEYTKVASYNHVTESQMKEALNEVFVGKVRQTSPNLPSFRFMHKSPKCGQQLVSRKQYESQITQIHVVEFEPPSFQLHVHTKGRVFASSLINDLGDTLDSAAHLSHLCRVRQGDFGFKEALHHYDWNEDTIRTNLYLPSSDPQINNS